MARPRTPTEVLELTGAFRRNPNRKREVGPKSTMGVGQAPEHLSELERSCWDEAIANAPAGVLTSGDRWLVEVASRLMAKFRSDWLSGAEMAQLTQALGKMGWTPADRSRVSAAEKEPETDEMSEFMQ